MRVTRQNTLPEKYKNTNHLPPNMDAIIIKLSVFLKFYDIGISMYVSWKHVCVELPTCVVASLQYGPRHPPY